MKYEKYVKFPPYKIEEDIFSWNPYMTGLSVQNDALQTLKIFKILIVYIPIKILGVISML